MHSIILDMSQISENSGRRVFCQNEGRTVYISRWKEAQLFESESMGNEVCTKDVCPDPTQVDDEIALI